MLATFAVMITLPPPLAMLAAENCTVTPAGIPLAESVTLEVNPLPGVIEIVVTADAPAAAVMLAGAALTENVIGDETVSAKFTVFDKLPLVPLIVIG